MKLKDLNPAVDKKILVILAGIMWCSVGILLISFAIKWLVHDEHRGLFFLAGFITAMPVHHFGFLRMADKNLKRLLPLEEKKCVFSFITWKSYIIVPVMVTMGIALRHSAIPKNYLSVVYNGIGLALFLSGLRYLRFFFMLLNNKSTNR